MHGDGSLHFSYSCHFKEFHFTFTRPLLGVGDTGSSGPGYFIPVSRSLLQLCPFFLSQWLSYWDKRSAAAVILVHTAEAESMLRRCHLHSALHVEGPDLPEKLAPLASLWYRELIWNGPCLPKNWSRCLVFFLLVSGKVWGFFKRAF